MTLRYPFGKGAQQMRHRPASYAATWQTFQPLDLRLQMVALPTADSVFRRSHGSANAGSGAFPGAAVGERQHRNSSPKYPSPVTTSWETRIRGAC